MHLASTQFGQLLKGTATIVVILRQYRQRHKNLIGMEARIASSQIANLGMLYRLNHRLRYKLYVVMDAGKMLHYIEQ